MIAQKVAEWCRWMLWYDTLEVVLISCGVLAVAILLMFVCARIIKVMIIGEDYDEND